MDNVCTEMEKLEKETYNPVCIDTRQCVAEAE